ncbi:hypothetical protein BKA81DRAFT_225692 [Phyllosticta paracitricarpa]
MGLECCNCCCYFYFQQTDTRPKRKRSGPLQPRGLELCVLIKLFNRGGTWGYGKSIITKLRNAVRSALSPCMTRPNLGIKKDASRSVDPDPDTASILCCHRSSSRVMLVSKSCHSPLPALAHVKVVESTIEVILTYVLQELQDRISTTCSPSASTNSTD